MKKTLLLSVMMTMMIVSGTAFAAEEPSGKAVIDLDGGKKGNITFPHETHQTSLNDCGICHNLFPKQEAVVKSMKAEGKLQKKQVMNHCLDCHRSMKKDGAKTGPTACAQCHR
jgi:hypothetical protein